MRPLHAWGTLLIISIIKSQNLHVSALAFLCVPLIPVLHNLDKSTAIQLFPLLERCKITTCSVSLRHREALEAMHELVKNSDASLKIGASTCVSEKQIGDAAALGASFVSTVFTTPTLVRASKAASLPILAGVLTYEEANLALELEVEALKFYPITSLPPLEFSHIIDQLRSTRKVLPPVYVAGGAATSDRGVYTSIGATGLAVGIECRGRSLAELDAILQTISAIDSV